VKPTISDQVIRGDEAALAHGLGEGGDDIGGVHWMPPLPQRTGHIKWTIMVFRSLPGAKNTALIA
jgi:hypothetical protein